MPLYSFSGTKNQTDPIRTEEDIVFQRNMKFVEFLALQAEYSNSGYFQGGTTHVYDLFLW